LQEAINSNNLENTKSALESLRNSAMEMGRSIYAGAQQSNQQNPNPQNADQQQDKGEPDKKS